VGAIAERDLPLLHRLEQRRLHLCGRAVDLVREQQVGEDRPAPRRELAGLLHEHHRAREVGGQQVGRELDAGELEVEHLAQRLHRERLREAGQTLDEQVTAAEQRHHHALEQRALADDDLAHLGERRLDLERLFANRFVQTRDVDVLHAHGTPAWDSGEVPPDARGCSACYVWGGGKR
jgi:hypothetical protein